MLWQNGVFDRAKKGRMNPHRQYGGQHERDILQQQTDRPNRHDPDLSAFYNADYPRLVHGVGKLARQSGKQEEGKNEQACRQRIEIGFHVRVAVDRIGGEQHHCGLEQIVIKRAQELGCEYRSEEHTSELQSLMRISYAVFCLKKKTNEKYKSK